MDPVLLARIQFGFTISFHIIFPSFTIGLSAYIATLSDMWLRTEEDRYRRLARFWTRIFAVSFAMGVVSGIVLSYELGTNWSRFSVVTGNVLGPLLGYEVLAAFFLEATFLGVLLFGVDRVPPWLHTLAAIAVALGTALSAFWILAANSWMHTPAGHEVRDGMAYPLDWLKIVFNPSFPYRFAHMVTAAYLTTAFVVLAVGARLLLGGRHDEEARIMVRMAIGLIIILAPLQLFLGDQHGLNTLVHQPIKVAAMEGHWDGSKPVPLILFAWPDEKAEANRFTIAVPNVSSIILTHRVDGLIAGLSSVPPAERPPVLPVFFAFRIMVGIGLVMIAAGRRRHLAAVARPAVCAALVSHVGGARLVDRVCRGDRGLDGDRDRPPALDRNRHPAHRPGGVAGRRPCDCDHARTVRHRLRYRVRHRHLLHQPADRARTGYARRRTATGLAEPPIHCGFGNQQSGWNRKYALITDH